MQVWLGNRLCRLGLGHDGGMHVAAHASRHHCRCARGQQWARLFYVISSVHVHSIGHNQFSLAHGGFERRRICCGHLGHRVPGPVHTDLQVRNQGSACHLSDINAGDMHCPVLGCRQFHTAGQQQWTRLCNGQNPDKFSLAS